MKQQNSHID